MTDQTVNSDVLAEAHAWQQRFRAEVSRLDGSADNATVAAVEALLESWKHDLIAEEEMIAAMKSAPETDKKKKTRCINSVLKQGLGIETDNKGIPKLDQTTRNRVRMVLDRSALPIAAAIAAKGYAHKVEGGRERGKLSLFVDGALALFGTPDADRAGTTLFRVGRAKGALEVPQRAIVANAKKALGLVEGKRDRAALFLDQAERLGEKAKVIAQESAEDLKANRDDGRYINASVESLRKLRDVIKCLEAFIHAANAEDEAKDAADAEEAQTAQQQRKAG